MTARDWLTVAVALIVVVGLAVDAYVHLQLAPVEPPAPSGHIGEGVLFYLEGAVSILAAALVLVFRRRWAFALAFVVAASALAAVFVTRFYDIGAIGPIPDMYEPAWYPQKTHAAVGEAVATGASLLGVFLARRSPTRGRRPWRSAKAAH